MTSVSKKLRTAALGVAIVAAAAAPMKQAHAADRSDVVAGVVGGVLLGSFIAAVANAGNRSNVAPVQSYAAPTQSYVSPQQTYHAPAQNYYTPAPVETYYEPAPTYYAPVPQYYSPPVTFSFGIRSGNHFGQRRNFRRYRHHHRFHGHRR